MNGKNHIFNITPGLIKMALWGIGALVFWARQQSDLSNKTVIYVPTETNLPILEATRMNQIETKPHNIKNNGNAYDNNKLIVSLLNTDCSSES